MRRVSRQRHGHICVDACTTLYRKNPFNVKISNQNMQRWYIFIWTCIPIAVGTQEDRRKRMNRVTQWMTQRMKSSELDENFFYASSAGMQENRINHNIYVYRNIDGIAQWHGSAIKHLLVIIFIDTLGSNDHMWKINDDKNMQRAWELQRAHSYTIFWLLVPIENHNNYCELTAANFHSYNNYSHCEMSTWNVWIWWINFAYYSNRANDWLALALGFAT